MNRAAAQFFFAVQLNNDLLAILIFGGGGQFIAAASRYRKLVDIVAKCKNWLKAVLIDPDSVDVCP